MLYVAEVFKEGIRLQKHNKTKVKKNSNQFKIYISWSQKNIGMNIIKTMYISCRI